MFVLHIQDEINWFVPTGMDIKHLHPTPQQLMHPSKAWGVKARGEKRCNHPKSLEHDAMEK